MKSSPSSAPLQAFSSVFNALPSSRSLSKGRNGVSLMIFLSGGAEQFFDLNQKKRLFDASVNIVSLADMWFLTLQYARGQWSESPALLSQDKHRYSTDQGEPCEFSPTSRRSSRPSWLCPRWRKTLK